MSCPTPPHHFSHLRKIHALAILQFIASSSAQTKPDSSDLSATVHLCVIAPPVVIVHSFLQALLPISFSSHSERKVKSCDKNISDPHRHHPPSILRGYTPASSGAHCQIHTNHLRRPCSYIDLPDLAVPAKPDTARRRKPKVDIKRFRIAVSESPPADVLFQMLLQHDARLRYNPAIPFCCVILINRNTGVIVFYIPYISLFCIPLVYTLYKICVSEIILREGRVKPGSSKTARRERSDEVAKERSGERAKWRSNGRASGGVRFGSAGGRHPCSSIPDPHRLPVRRRIRPSRTPSPLP